jgi:hypothetical protein
MATDKKAIPHVENNRSLLQGMAKNLVDKIYGPDGPPIGTRFVELEDLVVELGQLFQKSMMDQALSRQSGTFAKVAPKENECPGCGRLTQEKEPEPRIVQSRAGDAEWLEPHRHCDKCRKAFFPSVQEFGHRPGQLQPADSRQD